MPIGIHDARRLANLGRNQRQLLIGNLTYVDLDVQEFVRREFGADPPRNNIEVLETLNYARDRALCLIGPVTRLPSIYELPLHRLNPKYP